MEISARIRKDSGKEWIVIVGTIRLIKAAVNHVRFPPVHCHNFGFISPVNLNKLPLHSLKERKKGEEIQRNGKQK